MTMKVAKLNEEDIEKIKAMGKTPAQFVHEALGNLGNPDKVTQKVTLGNPRVTLGNPRVTQGNPVGNLTEKDVERMILKERERTRHFVTHIAEELTKNSPLTSASLPEGTQDWLVPVTSEDMGAVARDMQSKYKQA